MAVRPGDYTHFKAIVPLRRISVGTKQWRYYDHGPKSVPPLICLSGTAGTADVFYKQILSLTSKGYRVIAADAPPVWSHQEWVASFEKFLDMIGVHHVHIYGTSLGGFLAQLFAHYRPRRVKSLVLSNTFVDTRDFAAAMAWSSLITWTPEFMLKRYVLSKIQDRPQEPLIADSIDFVVNQLETLSREELASRLTLNTTVAVAGQIRLADSAITIMDTNDYCAIPQALKDEVGFRYPSARRASLKTGGDFPFLSRPDEVNLHLQLHLRRAGVDETIVNSRPTSKDSSGDSARNEDRMNDTQRSNKGTPQAKGGGFGESSLPASSSSSYEVDWHVAFLETKSMVETATKHIQGSHVPNIQYNGSVDADVLGRTIFLLSMHVQRWSASLELTDYQDQTLQNVSNVWTNMQWSSFVTLVCFACLAQILRPLQEYVC